MGLLKTQRTTGYGECMEAAKVKLSNMFLAGSILW